MSNDDRSFSINGKNFKLFKIDAFKQFHIVRRVGPILADLLPAMGDIQKALKTPDSLSEGENLDELAKVVSPIMLGLSKLSDEDANKVLYGLLSAVEIQQQGMGWARVSTDSALMFQDLDLPMLLQLAGRAFMYNLSGFFAALPASQAVRE